jgi:hypothetical protein
VICREIRREKEGREKRRRGIRVMEGKEEEGR